MYDTIVPQTIGEDLGFLSTLLERTACSTNGSDSCAAVTLFSSTLPTVYSAFVSFTLVLHFILLCILHTHILMYFKGCIFVMFI